MYLESHTINIYLFNFIALSYTILKIITRNDKHLFVYLYFIYFVIIIIVNLDNNHL